jgi:hydroxymethylpyrimidine pyrophosphatase-like HAD family hydrolase
MKKIALCYDFDGTLCPGYMQDQHLLPDCKIEPKIFWTRVINYAKEKNCDPTLGYLYLLEQQMRSANIKVNEETFKAYGKKLKLFRGVDEWFLRIKKFGKLNNVDVEHYIISSGLEDMIKGCSFAKDISKIYASSYVYDEEHKGIWPKLSVNYSNKVQFLFRIHKGTFDVFDQEGVNAKISSINEVNIPFENIYFFGDGETDVPTFSVSNKNNGRSICVYEKDNERSEKISRKLLSEGRVHHLVENDYSEDSEIDKLIKKFITSYR